MKLKLLTTAVCASLALSAWSEVNAADSIGILSNVAATTVSAAQQDQATDQTSAADKRKKADEKVAKTLKEVTVTGSLIPRAQIETSSPKVTITAEDIRAQGFTTVYQALKASPFATGGVQGNQTSGSFTQGAQTLSLFGLDPGFTLILIDGHPLVSYPLLYNGSSNFVDLSTIPTAMVDHIDIVPGNQSAIYGSSAIAGVVNIVLKQNLKGIDVAARVGVFSDGGGQSKRLQLTGGHQWGNLDATFGVQYVHSDPIWAYQRDRTDSSLDSPGTSRASLDHLHLAYAPDFSSTSYVDPGPDGCSNVGDLFGGTEKYVKRDATHAFCGSKYSYGYNTLQNESENTSGYLNLKYALGENAQLYGNVLFNHGRSKYAVGSNYTFWDSPYFIDANNGQLSLAQWAFAPEEVGSFNNIASRLTTDNYSSVLGIRGNLGDSDWAYDGYYARSQQWTHTSDVLKLADKVQSFFENRLLGPSLGTTASGYYQVFAPDWSKLNGQLTPADYFSFSKRVDSRGNSWLQNLNLQITNTNLFDLPGGAVGLGSILQIGNEHWGNYPNAGIIAGDFYGRTATSGHGTRKNYAAAVELNAPVFSWLTLDGSIRYDDYKYAGRSDGKATYKLGVEIRPTDTLLLRANYSTAFRAPDMGRIFLGPSGFYQTVGDYYACDTQQPDVSYADCTVYSQNIKGTSVGNRNLEDITAKSYGAGIVWSPTQNFNMRLDYLDIKIANEVQNISTSRLLRTEADCREGTTDINSALCKDALARVSRNQRGIVDGITTGPINIAKEHVRTFTAGANYRFDAGVAGKFSFGLKYNDELEHTQTNFPGDPALDLLNDPAYQNEFKSIVSGHVTWGIGNWTSTLYAQRLGAWPNYKASYTPPYSYDTKGAGKNGGWLRFNGSITYDLPHDASISLIVNNLTNKMPPHDSGFTDYPYYETNAYNVYGRSILAEFKMHFGE